MGTRVLDLHGRGERRDEWVRWFDGGSPLSKQFAGGADDRGKRAHLHDERRGDRPNLLKRDAGRTRDRARLPRHPA